VINGALLVINFLMAIRPALQEVDHGAELPLHLHSFLELPQIPGQIREPLTANGCGPLRMDVHGVKQAQQHLG